MVDERLAKVGDILSCGCRIVSLPWTRVQATIKLAIAIKDLYGLPVLETARLADHVSLTGYFDFSAVQMRTIWSIFFVKEDVDYYLDLRTGERLFFCPDDELPPVPRTVGEFLDKLILANLEVVLDPSCIRHQFYWSAKQQG